MTEDATVVKGNKHKRKAGKDIVPRLKVIEDQSFIMMASSRSKTLASALLWAPAPRDEEKPFLFMFDLPDGNGSNMLITLPMETPQAKAIYDAHPRRVPKPEMPPECPLGD